MPSTYTLNNGIELIATGEQSGTWGDTTNTNFQLLDTSLDGQVTVTLASTGSSGSPNTLPVSDGAASNGRNRLVIFADSSDLGATAYVQLTPNDAEKIIYVRNSLSGSRSILLFQGTYNASNDYEVPAGTTAVIFFDGAGSGAVAANVFNNAHFDNLNIAGDVTIGDDLSLNSDGAIINIGADADLQVTHSGSAGTITNATGDLTLDVAGDIILDADGADFKFRDGGAGFFTISNSSLDAVLKVEQSNEDFIIKGNDGGSEITALTLDMSEAGAATFNVGGVFNESGADSDFRIESTNSTHMLFVDASEDAIGIRKSDPTYGLDVGVPMRVITADNSTQLTLESTDADANDGPILDLTRNSASPADNDAIGSIRWRADDSAGNETQYADIRVFTNDVTDGTEDGQFNLRTMVNGSLRLRMKADPTETVFNEEGQDLDFRVESDGNANMLFVDAGNNRVGIGAAPSNPFEVNAGSGNAFIYTTGVTALVAQADGAGDTLILQTTDTSATNGPNIKFRRVATGADNDGLMQLGVNGFNDTGTEEIQFFRQRHFIIDASDGTEDGAFDMFNMKGGTLRSVINHDSVTTIFNDNSVDIDFRVESDNQTHMLFVDASTDIVTIGGSDVGTHAGMFNVAGNLGVITGSGNPIITIKTGGTGNNPGINYRAGDNIIFDNTLVASASTDYWRVGHGSSGSVTSEVLAVTTDSRVGINDTTPSYTVDVRQLTNSGDDGVNLQPNNQTQNMRYSFLGTTSTYFTEFMVDSADSGTAGYRYFKFYEGTRDNDGELLYLGYNGTVFNEGSADRDFRVESDTNANALFVDAGANEIGLFTSDPQSQMHFVSADATADYSFRISYSSPTDSRYANYRYSGVDVYAADDQNNGFYINMNGGTADGGKIVFSTGTLAAGTTERMSIAQGGTIVVNETGADSDFRVESDGKTHMLFVDANTNTVKFGRETISGASGQTGVSIDTNGRIISNVDADWNFEVYGAQTGRFRIFSSAGGGTQVGSITASTSSTSYNTSSDHRLKENVVDLTGATTRLKQLEPKRFNFIADADTTVDGFLAHEVQSVVPEAITGTHNEVDADGNPVYQGIDQAKLVPLLVATIKELEARITALENA